MKGKKILSGGKIGKTFLPYSPAIKLGELIFISGQASVDNDGNIVAGTFEEECRKSFENLKVILEAAGLGFDDVVQVRSYVSSQEYLPAYNLIYRDYFNEPYPARTTLIGCLGDLLKFEVDAIASKQDR